MHSISEGYYHTILKKIDTLIKNKPNKNIKINNQDKIIECSHCNIISNMHGWTENHFSYICPICNKTSFIIDKNNKTFPEEEKSTSIQTVNRQKPIYIINKKNHYLLLLKNALPFILIPIGLFFLFQPTMVNIKNSITLLFIGTILLFITSDIPKSKLSKEEKNMRLNNKIKDRLKTDSGPIPPTHIYYFKSSKIPINFYISIQNIIAIILIIWILFLFFITESNQLDIFCLLVLIAILIIRDLTDNLISKKLKHYLTSYILIFLFVYAVLVSEKIINFITILS